LKWSFSHSLLNYKPFKHHSSHQFQLSSFQTHIQISSTKLALLNYPELLPKISGSPALSDYEANFIREAILTWIINAKYFSTNFVLNFKENNFLEKLGINY